MFWLRDRGWFCCDYKTKDRNGDREGNHSYVPGNSETTRANCYSNFERGDSFVTFRGLQTPNPKPLPSC